MPTKATGIKPLSRHGDLEAIRSISYARYHALVTSLRARAKQKFVLRQANNDNVSGASLCRSSSRVVSHSLFVVNFLARLICSINCSIKMPR